MLSLRDTATTFNNVIYLERSKNSMLQSVIVHASLV